VSAPANEKGGEAPASDENRNSRAAPGRQRSGKGGEAPASDENRNSRAAPGRQSSGKGGEAPASDGVVRSGIIRRWPLGLGLLVFVVALLVALWPAAAPIEPAADLEVHPPSAAVASTPARPVAPPPEDRPASLQPSAAEPEPELAAEPAASAELDPNDHPHPITEEHERLAHQRRLIGALNDAVDLRDARQLRQLIPLYLAEDPADENKLAEGYERIADCLDQPGPASRAAASGYYERERASTLRRYVRRHCLDRE
jgi:hypothetical protein